MTKCRITLFICSLSGGGAERVTCNLANFLYKNGYDVDVVTLSNKDDTYRLERGIKRVNLLDNDERRGRMYNILTEWRRLKDYIDENLDVACYVTMLPINSYMLTRLRKRIKGKIIVSDRVDPNCYGVIKRHMVRYAAKHSDGLVVQTGEIRRWYKEINNAVIIPNAINADIRLVRDKKLARKFVAVGRLSKQKNYPMIIKAFKLFNKKHADYDLEIYGQGVEEEFLKRIVEEEGLSGKVFFKGYVKNVSERISNATGFVMASNYEGMSNALIEAMCIGLPCVVTDCDGGGASELIKDAENGVLVNKDAIMDMAMGMNRIVEDKKFRELLSDNAKKLRKRLDPDKIYSEWMGYIEEVLHKK